MSHALAVPVVMLTNAVAPDKLGGLERYVRELSAQLVTMGCPVTVVTKRTDVSQPADVVESDGVRILRHDVPSKRRPTFALEYPLAVHRAVRHALADQPDAVVHGHYGITTLPAALMRRPYVLTFHAPVYREMLFQREGTYFLPGPVQRAAVSGLRAAEALVVRRAARVTTLSHFMADEVTTLAPGVEPVLLPGGVDTEHFCPGPATPSEVFTDAQPLLFTARRLNARTGVQQLIEAMPQVLLSHPGARLAIAGDGRSKAELHALVVRLGVDHAVRLLGRVSDVELLNWYRRADLTVMPTQELEGFGLTTAESLACGTPVLVTPVGANAELVRDLDARLIAAGAHPEDLSSALDMVLGTPDLLEALAARSRAHVEPRWAWPTLASTFLELYQDLRPQA